MMVPIFTILSLIISAAAIFAVFSFLTRGNILGWSGPRLPTWFTILAILVLASIIAAPLKAARRASYRAMGFSWVGSAALLLWLAYNYIPAIRYIIVNLPGALATGCSE